MLFATLLHTVVRRGSMMVIDSSGRRHQIGDGSVPRSVIRLTRRHLGTTLALNPKLSIGEAYVEGSLLIEQGSVINLLTSLGRHLGAVRSGHWLNWNAHAGRLLPAHISVVRARHNVARYYDLFPALYELFLDLDQQYSCTYFVSRGDSLEIARAQKRRHIAAKLLLDRPPQPDPTSSISTTRLYAEATAATLQRRFDQLTDPAAHTLVANIRQRRGDDAALLAADLLARRRAERVSTAGA